MPGSELLQAGNSTSCLASILVCLPVSDSLMVVLNHSAPTQKKELQVIFRNVIRKVSSIFHTIRSVWKRRHCLKSYHIAAGGLHMSVPLDWNPYSTASRLLRELPSCWSVTGQLGCRTRPSWGFWMTRVFRVETGSFCRGWGPFREKGGITSRYRCEIRPSRVWICRFCHQQSIE